MPTFGPIKDLTKATPGAREVFVLAGLAGHVLMFRPLAQRLRKRWHLRGVLYPPFAGGPMTCESIEELATRMEPAFAEACDRPIIWGYSIGGSLAYAIAQRLARKGKTPTVIMIDTNLQSLREKTPRTLKERVIGRMLGVAKHLSWQSLVGQMRAMRDKFKSEALSDQLSIDGPAPQTQGTNVIPPPSWIRPGDPLIAFHDACYLAAGAYSPTPSTVRIVMVRTVADAPPAWIRKHYWPDRDHGWGTVAKVIGIVPCEGDHVSIIEPQNLKSLTVATRKALVMASKNV